MKKTGKKRNIAAFIMIAVVFVVAIMCWQIDPVRIYSLGEEKSRSLLLTFRFVHAFIGGVVAVVIWVLFVEQFYDPVPGLIRTIFPWESSNKE